MKRQPDVLAMLRRRRLTTPTAAVWGAPGRWWLLLPWLAAMVVGVHAAHGQSLLESPVAAPPAHTARPASSTSASPQPVAQPETAGSPGAPTPLPPSVGSGTTGIANSVSGLEGYSLFMVVPPKPKAWAKHDLVEIIINESSIQKFQQTNDLKKTYNLQAELSKFPSLRDLVVDATLGPGIGTVKPGVGVTTDSKYKGQATIDRKDTISAKITAEVIDIKPNGTLVLEAKESIQTDRETSTMVISGTCRGDDITKSNTVQSGQLAGLTKKIEHEGDVRSTAEKGIIPRVLEAIFNF